MHYLELVSQHHLCRAYLGLKQAAEFSPGRQKWWINRESGAGKTEGQPCPCSWERGWAPMGSTSAATSPAKALPALRVRSGIYFGLRNRRKEERTRPLDKLGERKEVSVKNNTLGWRQLSKEAARSDRTASPGSNKRAPRRGRSGSRSNSTASEGRRDLTSWLRVQRPSGSY